MLLRKLHAKTSWVRLAPSLSAIWSEQAFMMILLMIMMWCWWDRPPPAASPWWRPHVELGLHSSSSCQEGRSGTWYYHHHSHEDHHHNHHPRSRGHECAMRGALSIILAMVERIISIWMLLYPSSSSSSHWLPLPEEETRLTCQTWGPAW